MSLFIDQNVPPHIVYRYRLRILENDRRIYSLIRIASISGQNFTVNISPNPAIDQLNINSSQRGYDIFIYNSLGQTLYTKLNVSPENTVVNISKIPSGTLFIRIFYNNHSYFFNQIKL